MDTSPKRKSSAAAATGDEGHPAQDPIVGDTSQSVEFLKAMHGCRRVHALAISFEGRVEPKTFEAHDDPDLHSWIEKNQGKSNLYFAVNEARSEKRDCKMKKVDIVAAHYLHVDVDDFGALEQLAAFIPKPTAITASGGGFQAFWRLKKPTPDLPAVERCNKGLCIKLGGDNCHNIDRIMRIPGTVNILNPKKIAKGRIPAVSFLIEEHTDWSLAYSLGDFGEIEASVTVAITQPAQTSDEPVSLEDLSVGISEQTRSLIIEGDDLGKPIGTEGAKYPSRSEVVFRVTCDLVRAGASDQEIGGILVNPTYGIAESILEKPKPIEYATRQVASAKEAVSSDWPDRTQYGNIKPTFRNAKLAIRRLGLQAEYDTFHNRKKLGGYALQTYSGELTDNGCAALRNSILQNFNFDPGKEHTREAANALCIDNPVHPIREYLGNLKWDGKPRVASWLNSYMGADDTHLNREIGRIFFVAAVRRVRKPGTKFDTMLVLEGGQGKGKSTALALLVGDENFSDQEILTLDARAQAEALEGKWVYEIAELDGLSRADTSKVKAFASRSVDRARPAYGHYREDRPRQTIFVGTTNENTYLRDMTGNRRFWPVGTGDIDLEGIARDKDQLWAEAAHREAAGESIVLPSELWGDAQREQESRMEVEPWLDHLSEVRGEEVAGYERISSEQLLTNTLQIPTERQQQYQTKKLAQLMRKLGWDGPKPCKMADGRTQRGYERKLEAQKT